MKYLIFLSTILYTSFIQAQTAREPIYFINSIQIPSISKETYINPDNIKDLRVTHETTNGEIRITSKTDYSDYLTIEEILQKHFNSDVLNKDHFIKINGEGLFKLDKIRIDPTFYIYTKTTDISQAIYLGENYNNLTIIDIQLERKKRKPEVYIRGIDEITEALKP
ncbi:hypothetical protein [Reichenbachiella versicolor]|uniref:hypothetical protein n=1 Tax=Reichenbachiella versicolor TaxID=1821036 RepID=UPI000D6E31E3|nr:hypothetical protein [Reichenbachiella versicolor]